MNQATRRVFDSYALLLLLAIALPPWRGTPRFGSTGIGPPVYAWIWSPPQRLGWEFAPDFTRLLLEVISLTLVLIVAVLVLRQSPSDYSQ